MAYIRINGLDMNQGDFKMVENLPNQQDGITQAKQLINGDHSKTVNVRDYGVGHWTDFLKDIYQTQPKLDGKCTTVFFGRPV